MVNFPNSVQQMERKKRGRKEEALQELKLVILDCLMVSVCYREVEGPRFELQVDYFFPFYIDWVELHAL